MNNNSEIVIGVLGGMGTYATIHMFRQYAEVFPAEKEWDRPRIIIDNRCTMPSRVRAYIYHENTEKLVNELTDSLGYLSQIGCTHILLACNTSHLFLPEIFSRRPELKNRVLNIIDICTKRIVEDSIKEVFLLGSEGTIDSQIYQKAFDYCGEEVTVITPKKEEYDTLRKCIEAVKQNKYTEEIKALFLSLINRYDCCILGCTELPILYERYQRDVLCKKVYDPIMLALNEIKKEY